MPSEIALKPVVYSIPGMEAAPVRRGIAYRDELVMDLYYPSVTPAPAVVMVLGYPDIGVPNPLGCQFREMRWAIDWARLFAASGLIGVVYEARDPAGDGAAVIAHLRKHAAELDVDPERISVWAASGNVPVALSLLMNGHAQRGVLSCGYLLDLAGSTSVAEASAQYRFANPTAGKSVEDFPKDTPLFLARAGRDTFAGVNESIDAFVMEALRLNLPLTLLNHAQGPHGFDLFDDSAMSKEAVRAMLGFLVERAPLSLPEQSPEKLP